MASALLPISKPDFNTSNNLNKSLTKPWPEPVTNLLLNALKLWKQTATGLGSIT